jgi:hypothetical protein
MAITLDGTSGVTAPLFDGPLDAADLTGNVAAARITGALNASGSAPIYACRAWVNFNGESTVAIRASGNVSSITDNGTGDYTVNFTTAMPDANYCATGTTLGSTSGFYATYLTSHQVALSTSSVTVELRHYNGNLYDMNNVNVAIFR